MFLLQAFSRRIVRVMAVPDVVEYKNLLVISNIIQHPNLIHHAVVAEGVYSGDAVSVLVSHGYENVDGVYYKQYQDPNQFMSEYVKILDELKQVYQETMLASVLKKFDGDGHRTLEDEWRIYLNDPKQLEAYIANLNAKLLW